MSDESRWYRIYVEDSAYAEVQEFDVPPQKGGPYRYGSIIESIEEVEIRPAHQEPCDWEKEWVEFYDGLYYLRDDDGLRIKFCPECGRRLEER